MTVVRDRLGTIITVHHCHCHDLGYVLCELCDPGAAVDATFASEEGRVGCSWVLAAHTGSASFPNHVAHGTRRAGLCVITQQHSEPQLSWPHPIFWRRPPSSFCSMSSCHPPSFRKLLERSLHSSVAGILISQITCPSLQYNSSLDLFVVISKLLHTDRRDSFRHGSLRPCVRIRQAVGVCLVPAP